MIKKIICMLLPIAMIVSLAACGFRESDITESETYSALRDLAEENNLLDSAEQEDAPANGSASRNSGNARVIEYPYMPIEALINETPGNSNFTGEYYFIHLFPLEYGEDIEGGSGDYILGYAQHPDDESFSSMAIGGIPALEDWDDIFDNIYGFLVAFRFVGYSETYNMAYGIYVSHENAPAYFDMYS